MCVCGGEDWGGRNKEGGGVNLSCDDRPADMVNGDWFLTRTACVNPALALR